MGEALRFSIRDYVKKIKKAKVLRKIQESDFLNRRTVFITCGDDLRFDDWYSHHKCLCGRAPHTLSQNGGALQFTLDDTHRKRIFLEDIEEAIINKGIDTIVGLSHWPCLIARKNSMVPDEVLMRTASATAIVRDYFHKNNRFREKNRSIRTFSRGLRR